MSSRKTLLKHADELAQDVFNAWNASGEARVHKAFLYKTARHIAKNRRAFGILSDGDEDKESIARLMFVRAYKIYFARQAARFN
jgi:hypothetical protein